jgi:hypothetical protein
MRCLTTATRSAREIRSNGATVSLGLVSETARPCGSSPASSMTIVLIGLCAQPPTACEHRQRSRERLPCGCRRRSARVARLPMSRCYEQVPDGVRRRSSHHSLGSSRARAEHPPARRVLTGAVSRAESLGEAIASPQGLRTRARTASAAASSFFSEPVKITDREGSRRVRSRYFRRPSVGRPPLRARSDRLRLASRAS